jgi:hypothetical protein
MSRRSGQDSKPFKAGKWWHVRVRFDVAGVEKRQHKSLKVAPVSLRLSKPELQRRAKAVIEASGANSEDRFNRVVLGEGVTFRERAEIYLQEVTTRNRNPIEDPTSIQAALRKWINPVIGDLPLTMVDNLSLKPLVKKMVEGACRRAPARSMRSIASRLWHPRRHRMATTCIPLECRVGLEELAHFFHRAFARKEFPGIVF